MLSVVIFYPHQQWWGFFIIFVIHATRHVNHTSLYFYTGFFIRGIANVKSSLYFVEKYTTMHPVYFEGSTEIKKPKNMTDEECMSAWAKFGFGKLMQITTMQESGLNVLIPGLAAGIDAENFPYYMTAWKPNKEDLEALNRGEPVYVKVLSQSLPPMALFTINEKGEPNF